MEKTGETGLTKSSENPKPQKEKSQTGITPAQPGMITRAKAKACNRGAEGGSDPKHNSGQPVSQTSENVCGGTLPQNSVYLGSENAKINSNSTENRHDEPGKVDGLKVPTEVEEGPKPEHPKTSPQARGQLGRARRREGGKYSE